MVGNGEKKKKDKYSAVFLSIHFSFVHLKTWIFIIITNNNCVRYYKKTKQCTVVYVTCVYVYVYVYIVYTVYYVYCINVYKFSLYITFISNKKRKGKI